jgi:hypothetical protein
MSTDSFREVWRLRLPGGKYYDPPDVGDALRRRFVQELALRLDRVCHAMHGNGVSDGTIGRAVELILPEVQASVLDDLRDELAFDLSRSQDETAMTVAQLQRPAPLIEPNLWRDELTRHFVVDRQFLDDLNDLPRNVWVGGGGGGGAGGSARTNGGSMLAPDHMLDAAFATSLYGFAVLQPDWPARPHENPEAIARSKELLMRHLSADQAEQLRRHEYFEFLAGNGRHYRVTNRNVYNTIDIVSGEEFCIQVPGVPIYDQMLTCKLMLETDPSSFFRIANSSRGGRPRPAAASGGSFFGSLLSILPRHFF